MLGKYCFSIIGWWLSIHLGIHISGSSRYAFNAYDAKNLSASMNPISDRIRHISTPPMYAQRVEQQPTAQRNKENKTPRIKSAAPAPKIVTQQDAGSVIPSLSFSTKICVLWISLFLWFCDDQTFFKLVPNLQAYPKFLKNILDGWITIAGRQNRLRLCD